MPLFGWRWWLLGPVSNLPSGLLGVPLGALAEVPLRLPRRALWRVRFIISTRFLEGSQGFGDLVRGCRGSGFSSRCEVKGLASGRGSLSASHSIPSHVRSKYASSRHGRLAPMMGLSCQLAFGMQFMDLGYPIEPYGNPFLLNPQQGPSPGPPSLSRQAAEPESVSASSAENSLGFFPPCLARTKPPFAQFRL